MSMDFYQIKEVANEKKGSVEVYPDFRVVRSKDLMVRGKGFYAIWDAERGLWSTDEYDVQRLIDEDLDKYTPQNQNVISTHRKYLGNFSSNTWMQFRKYVGNISDSSTTLDENLTFANTDVKKEDYVSRRLNYPLAEGDYSAWDELVGTLYDPEERAKIEWAIGAIVSGDAKTIQKFLVLYGPGGTGKSTVLNIVQKLFDGYYALFEAKALTGNNNNFAMEVFKSNPLVAIQHDGDLSKIEDNTKLNSVISHEEMIVNEKFKAPYPARVNAFLFMGTNKPVKITDAKSGIIRRLIDVKPTGQKIPPRKYQALMSQIDFELGAIAFHCLEVYRDMGKEYYSGYQPTEMMLQTDVFFNFIEANFDIFKSQDGATLKQAYTLYKEYCDEALVDYKMPMYRFREELRNYFTEFHESKKIDDQTLRSYYEGFIADKFKSKKPDERAFSLVMDETESIFDKTHQDCPAQYSNDDGIPTKKWVNVTTTLKDIDTSREHYVKIPEHEIVIDFDLKDGNGEKSAERNLEAASRWPSTYAEFSKSESGIHLHYIFDGDVSELSRVYDEGIEIKVYTGDSSLRRKMSRANNVPIATINSGLPLKEKKMIDQDQVKSEKGLRDLIARNLRKEIHPGTKPSMDFIAKILDDAYESGLKYDVSDLRPKILAFANNSSNNALYCIKLVQNMKFQSEHAIEENIKPAQDERLVFFDVEVYPNLFMICWKYENDKNAFGQHNVVTMINPKSSAVESLLAMKLIGFNCRRYDNHILYAALMGYTNMELYKLSQKIINGSRNAMFREAYNISYTDIYDYASKKQSLKKWEIELGLHHMESELPWDEPVPPEKWEQVEEYCCNDVVATEETHHYLEQDFVARQMLSALSGLSLNATTQQHATKIIFGDDPRPQQKFVYTDLSEEFPGYVFEMGKSTYWGEDPGEGGYVYAEPGIYEDVCLLDIQSMHPTTIEQLDLFGPYTKVYSDLKRARVAIKHRDLDAIKDLFGGKLVQYLNDDDESWDKLSYALKIVINIVYGLTSAGFDNAFRDPRNIDNIVAKRGALFMINLKHYVQDLGYTVAHIKTDSIKIPNADKKIIDLIMEYGEKYGYIFEHEETYAKFCLVNDAVYIAKTKDGRKPAHWTATGAQFQHPYVFKTLFSHERIIFKDLCETKTVTGESAIYLDFTDQDAAMVFYKEQRHFVGRAGQFTPVINGGVLYRVKDGKDYAVAGTKGYKWLESEMVEKLHKEDDIDMSYFTNLTDTAMDTIRKFGDAEAFIDD